jgi:NAD(P)H dehydrogenase (quinone)
MACGQVTREHLRGIDALITGSAVQQRNVNWQMKKFIDEVCEPSWFYDDLVGKVGGVFTVGGGHGNAGGGAEIAQIALVANLASLGMLILPHARTTPGFNHAGMHWGPHLKATNQQMQPVEPDELDPVGLEAFYHYGATVARVAVALQGVAFTSLGNDFPDAGLKAQRGVMDGSFPIGAPK